MKKLIMDRGFIETENPNEYVRGDWTIRFDEKSIEVFNDPDKATGVYYITSILRRELEEILDEIDTF